MKTGILTITAIFFSIVVASSANAGKKDCKFASSLENATDIRLEIEGWMISESYWNLPVKRDFDTAKEESLHLETWMLNSLMFDQIKTEADQSLRMETWMVSRLMWDKPENVCESELELEDWMISESFWKQGAIAKSAVESDKDLKLEAWMMNANIWKL